MQIEEYRQRMEQFAESLNRELYCYHAGIRKTLATGELYSDYSDLFSLEAIRELECDLKRCPDSFLSRKKSLARLRWFAVEQYLESNADRFFRESVDFEARRTFQWNGKEIALVQIPLLLSREADGEERRRLSALQAAAQREVESIRKQMLARLKEAAGALGFESCLDAMQSCAEVSYRDLSQRFEELLAGTEALYFEQMNASLLATVGLSIREARHCDVPFWKWKNEIWEAFSRDRLVPAVDGTFSDLGLRPEREGAILLDLEDRPAKCPRPFSLPVRVPYEIRIVMHPGGQCGDYAALLHESGHAHHFAWTSPSLPAEFRLHGDRALSETYAFLFESLLRDGEWLHATFGSAAPEFLLRSQALYRAYLVRRCAGRLRFEIEGGALADDAARLYLETLRRCTGLEHDADFRLEDPAEGVESADYLRAWTFEAMLRDFLRSKYGKAWYRNRSAGGFLKEIWETGLLYSAAELSGELGLGPLDASILQDEIAEGLRR